MLFIVSYSCQSAFELYECISLQKHIDEYFKMSNCESNSKLNNNNQSDRNRYVKIVGWTGILLNIIFLFAFEYLGYGGTAITGTFSKIHIDHFLNFIQKIFYLSFFI